MTATLGMGDLGGRPQPAVDEASFEELKAMIGFGEEDAAALRGLLPAVEDHLDGMVAHFYEVLTTAPQASQVFESMEQVERLQKSLREWLREVVTGPHDAAYFLRHRHIGTVHVTWGVPVRYVFSAMSVLRRDLMDVAQVVTAGEIDPVLRAIEKVTTLDLAIIVGTYMDGREDRRLASYEELIVSNLPVTLMLVDDAGIVTSATASSTRLFDAEEALGRHYLDVVPEELAQASRIDTHLARAMATGHDVTLLRVDAEVRHRTRSFSIVIVPLVHRRARALIHFKEVTEAIETEARLRQSETLAQLGAFSAAVAHELRNPLAGISGAVQVIARSLDPEDRRRDVMTKVEQQIVRLNRMVSDLLALARPAEPDLRKLALGPLVRAAADLVAAEHPGVAIIVEGEGQALADGDLVQQILLNLLQNAVQAMGDQGSIGVRVAPGLLMVTDSGPGVPLEMQDRIFTPFFTTRTRGTGLGLAISRRAAEAMGATLSLLADVGGGGCFQVLWES